MRTNEAAKAMIDGTPCLSLYDQIVYRWDSGEFQWQVDKTTWRKAKTLPQGKWKEVKPLVKYSVDVWTTGTPKPIPHDIFGGVGYYTHLPKDRDNVYKKFRVIVEEVDE